MVGNPSRVDGKFIDAPGECAASSIARHEVQRQSAAAGGTPLQGDELMPAAAKPNNEPGISNVPEAEAIAPPGSAKAIVPVNDGQAQTVISPGTASDARGPVYSTSWRCEVAVEDAHWQRYFGPQYHRFRNVYSDNTGAG
jgi:hypothetical protein